MADCFNIALKATALINLILKSTKGTERERGAAAGAAGPRGCVQDVRAGGWKQGSSGQGPG